MKPLFVLVLVGGLHSIAFAQDVPSGKTSTPTTSTTIESHAVTSAAFDKPPKIYYAPDPKFSKEARAANFSGNVLLRIHITAAGVVDKATVIRGVGYGLDEEAQDVARQYRFRPALKNDAPVVCELVIEVDFVLEP